MNEIGRVIVAWIVVVEPFSGSIETLLPSCFPPPREIRAANDDRDHATKSLPDRGGGPRVDVREPNLAGTVPAVRRRRRMDLFESGERAADFCSALDPGFSHLTRASNTR